MEPLPRGARQAASLRAPTSHVKAYPSYRRAARRASRAADRLVGGTRTVASSTCGWATSCWTVWFVHVIHRMGFHDILARFLEIQSKPVSFQLGQKSLTGRYVRATFVACRLRAVCIIVALYVEHFSFSPSDEIMRGRCTVQVFRIFHVRVLSTSCSGLIRLLY